LFLMNYDLQSLAVVNLFIVPKHFFVQDIIEERKPLAATAKRAGWIGSNILLSQIPESGKIHIVKSGVIRPNDAAQPSNGVLSCRAFSTLLFSWRAQEGG